MKFTEEKLERAIIELLGKEDIPHGGRGGAWWNYGQILNCELHFS